MSSPDYSQAVADILDGLGDTPTPDEVYHAVKNYSVDNVVAATASTAKAGGGGGGGSQPTSREDWTGNGVEIPDADGAWLTWDNSGGPDAVLDITTPAHPTVSVSGVYLVSVVVNVGAMSNGGYFDAGLHLDRGGFNASQYAFSSEAGLSPADGRVSDVSLAFAWYITAGNQVGVFVDNHDGGGGGTRSFSIIYAHIQRLS